MAEGLALNKGPEQDPTSAAEDFETNMSKSPTCTEIENVNDIQENATTEIIVEKGAPESSDYDSEDMFEERRRLRDHQHKLGQASRPRPLYATLAAGNLNQRIFTGRSDGSRRSPLERNLPRSVSIHSPDGVINCRSLLERLNCQGLELKQLRLLPNNDAEITFATIKDREKFYRLPFVSRPAARSWEPRMRNPPPIWVRIRNKPEELLFDVIQKKFSAFGRILFARENTFLGSNTKNGIITLKMVISNPIPSYVHIGPYCLMVNHDNQPQTCRKCDRPDHLARECAAVRCFNCGERGHTNAACPAGRKCHGCGSPDHHLVQCSASWVPEPSEESDSDTEGSQAEEDAHPLDENRPPPPSYKIRALATTDGMSADVEGQPDCTSPNTPEKTEATNEDEPVSTAEELVQTGSWGDHTEGELSEVNRFPSPLFVSVDAPLASSKRALPDDGVSDVSAVRRPSTKKRPKGRRPPQLSSS